MKASELEEKFAVPGVMRFKETASGLAYLLVTAPAAQATICMYGAHLTHWKPKDQKLAIFLSERTEIIPGIPIRGGVPVIFPWFGPRHDGKEGPMHGFARLEIWELESAKVVGDEVHLTLTLGPNEISRALGFDNFRLTYRVLVGKTLTLELTVENTSNAPLVYEEALHTYFAISDASQTTVSGLAGTTFLDKVDEMKLKVQAEEPLELTGKIDRVYRNTTAKCEIDDTVGGRKIGVAKEGSQTTVVWNPWAEGAATIKDLAPDAWRGMLCVETANAGENAVTLAAGAKHTMRAVYSVEGSR
jgi:glucose-6-phosphate 1-epimerase